MHARLKAHILHRIPGRVRIQIPAARHQEQFFTGLKARLVAVEGVRSVTVNPAAASVTIKHDRNIDPLAGWIAVPSGPVTANAAPTTCQCCGASAVRGVDDHGTPFDMASVVAKLLPLVLPKHPLVQVAELVAEPVLRAVVGSATKPARDAKTVFLPA